jgi:hypothetical protein
MMRPYYLVAPGAQGAEPLASRAETPTSGATLLMAPQPNPAEATATFRFTLRETGAVELDLFSVTGQRVRSLAAGTYDAGEHAIRWDGRDDTGRTVAAGVYFVNLRAAGASVSRKLLLTP